MIFGKHFKPTIPPVPAGTYFATCVYEINIGEQPDSFKQNSYSDKFLIGFELNGMTLEVDGKVQPRYLDKTYNICKTEKGALRKMLDGWLGKKISDEEWSRFDSSVLLGRTAMLTVSLSESGEYANIENIMQIPMGMPQPVYTSPLYHFDIDDGFDMDAFNALPEFIQRRIKKSTQYQKEFAPVQEVRVDVPQGTGTAQANTAVPGVPEGVCPI